MTAAFQLSLLILCYMKVKRVKKGVVYERIFPKYDFVVRIWTDKMIAWHWDEFGSNIQIYYKVGWSVLIANAGLGGAWLSFPKYWGWYPNYQSAVVPVLSILFIVEYRITFCNVPGILLVSMQSIELETLTRQNDRVALRYVWTDKMTEWH